MADWYSQILAGIQNTVYYNAPTGKLTDTQKAAIAQKASQQIAQAAGIGNPNVDQATAQQINSDAQSQLLTDLAATFAQSDTAAADVSGSIQKAELWVENEWQQLSNTVGPYWPYIAIGAVLLLTSGDGGRRGRRR